MKYSKYLLKSFVIFLTFSTISTYAADILVNSSGLLGSYTTISDAVQAANAGDRILISPQSIPYQDSLIIDKDLTLMPYADNTTISFDGHIRLVLDNINNFTIIGFRRNLTETNNYFWNGNYGYLNNSFKSITSQINDTTINSLSVINIIDCQVRLIRLDQPKTSLYLSYSLVGELAFSHGNLVGNALMHTYFGIYDYSQVSSGGYPCNWNSSSSFSWLCEANEMSLFWEQSPNPNYLNSSNRITECELFSGSVAFGNTTVSDTCLIVANKFFKQLVCFNQDFVCDIRNNDFTLSQSGVIFYLTAPSSIGTNQIINNDFDNDHLHFNLAYCPTSNLFNFSDISIRVLNNKVNKLHIQAPQDFPNTLSYNTLPLIKDSNSIYSYNNGIIQFRSGGLPNTNGLLGLDTSIFNIGVNANGELNPSLEFLDLDLTPNSLGLNGGSHEISNYLRDGWIGYAGFMPRGGKARITYLNLPTQIFNPSNIRVKSKAVHGN